MNNSNEKTLEEKIDESLKKLKEFNDEITKLKNQRQLLSDLQQIKKDALINV